MITGMVLLFVSICINHESFISAAAEMKKAQAVARGMCKITLFHLCYYYNYIPW